jgi:hypothetical protein
VNREEVFDAWSPEGAVWSRWVKPVLFACLPEEQEVPSVAPAPWLEPALLGPMNPAADVAVIVDLPGDQAVWTGLVLADCGFQPTPLFNAVPHPDGFVNLDSTMDALVGAAQVLASRSPQELPAFLLDANRAPTVRPSVGTRPYDNRSLVRDTDLPSPALLQKHGVRRVLLIQATLERPAPDLESVLLAWQRGGLELWRLAKREPAAAEPFQLRPRSWYLRLLSWLDSSGPRRRWDGIYGRYWQQGG